MQHTQINSTATFLLRRRPGATSSGCSGRERTATATTPATARAAAAAPPPWTSRAASAWTRPASLLPQRHHPPRNRSRRAPSCTDARVDRYSSRRWPRGGSRRRKRGEGQRGFGRQGERGFKSIPSRSSIRYSIRNIAHMGGEIVAPADTASRHPKIEDPPNRREFGQI